MTDRTCTAPGCESPSRARSLCNAHYKRLRRTGTVTASSAEDRFFSRVTEDENGCWIFSKANSKGYAAFYENGAPIEGHLWAWRLFIGDVPDGLTLDHLCRVRVCVNPWHLDPVPHRVNILRGIGPAAINARRTQCVNGHPFTSENTYLTPDGRRQCRVCIRLRDRQRRRS